MSECKECPPDIEEAAAFVVTIVDNHHVRVTEVGPKGERADRWYTERELNMLAAAIAAEIEECK